MQQLRFTAVHEDGRHLVLTDPGDGEEYLVEIDERLRDAIRGRRSGIGEHPAEALTPRTVQAMMRAGESAEDVAAATGWPVDRVQRYEAPIVAEREHVAGLARRVEVRGRAADGTERPTLESRVRERLTARGVDPDLARWDATRPEGGPWTVLVGFVAGNRDRRAAWRFDLAARHVEALDDEARWLSEDEQALPGGAGGYAGLGGDGTGAVDLVATMRRRSRARGRRRGRGGAAEEDPAAVPGREEVPEELLPLEDLRYDPATMGLPPAAHGRPEHEQETEQQPGAGAESREDFAADARAEVAADEAPEAIAEPPEPDEEGEEEAGPQEATLEDFFGGNLDEDPEEPEEVDAEQAYEEQVEYEGDIEPETVEAEAAEPETTEPEADGAEAAESEDRGDTQGGQDAASDAGSEEREDQAGPPEQEEPAASPLEDAAAHDEEDAGPALVAVADPEDVADEPAEPTSADDRTERATSTEQPGTGTQTTKDKDTGSTKRGGSRRKGRPSVPSWDDIMFGARDQS